MNKKVANHFKKVDRVLYEQYLKFPDAGPEKADNYFIRLTRSIVGQQLSTKVASVIYNRFLHLFPDEEVKPEVLVSLKDEELRSIGISWAKIKYLKDLAAKVLTKEVDLDTIETLSNEEVTEMLVQVNGIGPWTAEMFQMFALGRPDIFSHGDLGLKNAIKNLYGLENPTREVIEEISIKWSPYRTYACRVLWETLDNKPT